MFFVKTKKRELSVSFVHAIKSSTQATQCLIREGEETVALGTTFCHPKDNYCKNTGRKISLARALKNFSDSPTLRKLFWDAYAEKRGGFD